MKIFSNNLKSGEDYNKTKPIIQICIIKENTLFKNNEDLIDEYTISSKKYRERNLIDTYFKIFIVDLGAKIDYTLTNKRLVSWIEILKAESEEELKKVETNPLTEEVIKEMMLFMNNEYVQSYELKERLIRSDLNTARSDGIKEGQEIGEKEKAFEIARKMIEKNIAIETIKECTDLSIEELNKLKEELEEK